MIIRHDSNLDTPDDMWYSDKVVVETGLGQFTFYDN